MFVNKKDLIPLSFFQGVSSVSPVSCGGWGALLAISLGASFFTGITKLGVYSRCLSVIPSTIPKSKKTALAIILAPTVLGIDTTALRPLRVVRDIPLAGVEEHENRFCTD